MGQYSGVKSVENFCSERSLKHANKKFRAIRRGIQSPIMLNKAEIVSDFTLVLIGPKSGALNNFSLCIIICQVRLKIQPKILTRCEGGLFRNLTVGERMYTARPLPRPTT